MLDSNKLCVLAPALSGVRNPSPKACSDDEFPWDREGGQLETKYFFVCHAELNAILNYRGGSLEGSRIYATLFPCNECAKAIIQAGIKEIIYACDKYADSASVVASKMMFKAAGVKLTPYTVGGKEVNINL